ncbi:MAG: glycosyltransferase [Oscillospiraceae bacterium]|nr:glycosyltransferase [Oscillospiraceae bacterium]
MENFIKAGTGKKIGIFVCFNHAHIGGAMTSLINFLNALDTDKYDVDVMFYENDPGNRYGIKEEIRILPQGKQHRSMSASNLIKKAINPLYLIALVRGGYYKKVKHNKEKAVQIMSQQGYKYSRKISREYDAAVAYDVGWCMNYVINRVNAARKILWQHLESEKAGMDLRIDGKCYERADALAFVSTKCMEDYLLRRPEHRQKSWFIPNLLSTGYVRGRGEENVRMPFENPDAYLKLITVARVKFGHKGFDRGVDAFAQLKKDGLLDRVKWIIVGDGRDLPELRKRIHEEGLESVIYPIGARDNPIPYLKECDVFFLPSRYEGKPMAVTEALIMGLVPVVTEYASAREQIRHGTDGLVFPNSRDGIYRGLTRLFSEPDVLEEMKRNIAAQDYGNEKEISAFDAMLEQVLQSGGN